MRHEQRLDTFNELVTLAVMEAWTPDRLAMNT